MIKAPWKHSSKPYEMSDPVVKDALREIKNRWKGLTQHNTLDKGTLIGLPHPYVIPSALSKSGLSFGEQYYWDTYFVALGMTEPEHQELVEGMLENLIYLNKRFSLIPNASRMYMTGRSQPPILTSLIFHVYDTYDKSIDWLHIRIKSALSEYTNVWTSTSHPTWHNVHCGLSRYYDVNNLHDLAEAESGWDMTTRFERKCLDYLPIDLNSLLYKYEVDFARYESLAKNAEASERWQSAAKTRKVAIDDLMWSKRRGAYFDFNYQKGDLGDVWSLATYYPMWVGMASEEQAAKLVKNLSKFEKEGGLTTTLRTVLDPTKVFGSLKVQWAYPNGWAPLHLIVIEGLRKYEYHDLADRITHKWIKTNLDWFAKHGEFIEKYNVVDPERPPVDGVYPLQSGFGWTNAVLFKLLNEQSKREST